MALPVIATPTYEMVIPSSKKKVKFRPFLVKEEKALLIAQQSEDSETMMNTLKSIITSCVIDKIDVDKLATFDIEYIFTQLRAKSVGEYSDLVFNCLECNDPKAKMPVKIDLTALEVQFDANHKDTIELFDGIGVKMKYPSLSSINRLKNLDVTNIDDVFNIIIECVDFVYDAEQVYPAADQTKEELEQFINNLTQDQFEKIQNFFETMPRLEKTIEFDCPVCKHHHTHTIRGLDSFF